MNFSRLAQYLNYLEKEDSRLKMTAILAELFNQVLPEEIDKSCYLVLGRLAPKFKGIDFNMADKMVIKSLSLLLGKSVTETSAKIKAIGDIGDFTAGARKNHQPKEELTINEVYQGLLAIAEEEGPGSVERKVSQLAGLLQNLDYLGAKYIVRMVVGRLRLGFSDMTILDALSWSKKGDKSWREPLEKAYNTQADIGRIAFIFKKEGLDKIKKIQPIPGIPIRAAKAERLKNTADILTKLKGQCLIEPKYDGFRLMLHLDKNKQEEKKGKNLSLFIDDDKNNCFVQIFSRALDNMTHMFPDLVKAVRELPAESVIIDGEAIAVNPHTGKFLPFQETVQRKRKHGIDQKAKEIPLIIFAFDLLYLNGISLMTAPFSQRRQQLEQLLQKAGSKTILLTEQKKVTKPEEFDEFFKQVQADGLEGLMAKKANSDYKAGVRDHNWVKYKIAMQSDLADTLDCVVMGYYRGKGKRTKFGLGAFLVGVVDKERVLSVSKIGTGLTDKQWQEMYSRCEKIKTKIKPKNYQLGKNLNPDIWCEPELVVEIEADTITKSPLHAAGLALRFPRLKKFRDDKTIDEASTWSEFKKMYKKHN